MKPVKDMTLGELAAFVSSQLERHDIYVVLTGGSCVALWSEGRYVSADLDFIDNHFTKRRKVRQALAEIGFAEENRYFKHPDTGVIVEFPAGPLAVGTEPVKEVVTLSFSTGSLNLLSPTDCVKDRLAAYYHWQDRQCLKQALLVAAAQAVAVGELERWSRKEKKLQEFRKIAGLFRKTPQ